MDTPALGAERRLVMATPFKTYRTASGLPISATLEKAGQRGLRALGKALYREAVGIMAESQPLVPVDTTALRSSGYVAEPVQEGTTVRVEFGYGGPAAKINPKTGESTDAYALMVHENLEAFHKVGSAKYLELPFNQATSGMTGRLAAAIDAELSGAPAPNFVYGGLSELGQPET